VKSATKQHIRKLKNYSKLNYLQNKKFYHLFNPNKALQNDDLENYYVEMDQNETNIEKIKIRLELSLETHEPIKLIFTGHLGSGKTTALNRLVSYLNSEEPKFYRTF
jgi:Cdc6-like AAA superfamily ATPase